MSKLNQEELLEELDTAFGLVENMSKDYYTAPGVIKKSRQAEQQIRELIKIFFAKEISTGPIKKDISQPDLIKWLQGINQAATAVKDYYVMKATTQLIETIQKPGVTEEWTEKKAKELHRYAESFQTSVEDFQDYIRKLFEEMPVK